MQALHRSSSLRNGLVLRLFSTSAHRMADRNYGAAVEALNSLQSNFAAVEAVRKSRQAMNQQAIPEMIDWLRRIGYEPSELNRLNIIHIAGTKGKGSTSAMISSILCQYLDQSTPSGQPLQKIGLYTSPHLRSVRERIRINHDPLSEEAFAKYFFEVWDRLESDASSNSLHPGETAKPMYFRFLTLMAFHVYISERVDATILECGIGGEYDSTNIFTQPAVTGISSLGIDHTSILGDTIEDIAWHKAGIMKPGVPIFSAPQPLAAENVLRERATAKGSPIKFVKNHPELADNSIKLGLAGDFQKINASLAIAVSEQYLTTLGITTNTSVDSKPSEEQRLPPQFRRGLEQVQWGGRCETRHNRNVTWFIDGGHTLESIKLVAEWYATQIAGSDSSRKRVLFFNQQTRDAVALAQTLHRALSGALLKDGETHAPLFTHAIFTTNLAFSTATGSKRADLVFKNINETEVEALTVQRNLAATWAEIDKGSQTYVKGSVQEGIDEVRRIAGEAQGAHGASALVTGSLHLVGGVLEVLESEANL